MKILGADANICSHRIEILPEDGDEIWVTEAEPSVPSPLLQAPSVQHSDPPHIKGQQGTSHNVSMHPAAMSINVSCPGLASVSTPTQEAKRLHPAPDMTSLEGAPLAAPPRYASASMLMFILTPSLLIAQPRSAQWCEFISHA